MSSAEMGNAGMNDSGLFRRRTAKVLILASGTALAVTLFFLVFAAEPSALDSAGADTYSVSALGYRALVELLEPSVPVLVSRQDSANKAKPQTPLLVLEPSGQPDRIERLNVLLDVARKRQITTVVVLPKWSGSPQSGRKEWVDQVELRPTTEPARVSRAAFDLDQDLAAMIRRPTRLAGEWRGELAELGAQISLTAQPQLLAPMGEAPTGDHELIEVLGIDQGMLIARSPESRMWVIADPDLLNTAGLARGANALAAHTLLIDHLTPNALIVDEVLHGFGETRNLWRELIRFPLICVALHLLALALLALWATTSRFGRPLPAPSRLPPGKLTLVDNTARLLSLGGDLKRSLTRYLELTLRQVTRHPMHPRRPSSPAEAGLRSRVERLGALASNRGVSEDLEVLASRLARWSTKTMDARQALELARALHRWRKEMLDGPARRSSAG